jgi:RNA polymerase sigma-70 factor (ECF subfamily)
VHTSINDKYLLQKLKQGDVSALEHIFDSYYTDICRYLLLYINNSMVVEGIVQELFIYIWEKREELHIHTSIESYLYNASKYKALNHLRNEKKQKEIREKVTKQQATSANLSEEIVEADELKQIIENAVNLLPNKCQKIFRLSREDNLTNKEIASLLNLSVKTVENQMGTALKKLRVYLRPYHPSVFAALLTI